MLRKLLRILRWPCRISAAILTLFLLIVNARLYSAPSAAYQPPHLGPGTLEQLAFLRAAIDDGAADDMQTLFPEGYFFTHVLYGLAWSEVARRGDADAALKARAIREARWAFQQIDTTKGREPFSPTTDPPYGVFYLGWRARLMGGLLFAQTPDQRDPADLTQLRNDCETLAAALRRSPTPFLCAYPDQCWPCDTVVAVAAIAMHDRVFEPRYANLILNWSDAADSFADPANHHLPHRINPRTNATLQPRRATSQVIINRFLPEFDYPWASCSYFAFKRDFADSILGIPALREYPRGTSGPGDVDSGPLVFGCSASATVVALAAANMHGDAALADRITQSAEALGFPITLSGRKRYVLGLMPVGDAFLVWARTSAPIDAPDAQPAVRSARWRVMPHALSLAAVILLWIPAFIPRSGNARKHAQSPRGQAGTDGRVRPRGVQ